MYDIPMGQMTVWGRFDSIIAGRASALPIAIELSELRPGMVLAHAVANQYSTLVTANTTLAEGHIQRLRELEFDGLVQVVDPLLDSCVEFADDSADHKLAAKVHRQVVQALEAVGENLRPRTTLSSGDLFELQTVLASTMDQLQDHPVAAAYLVKTKSADEYLNAHVANVFYLSMLVGRQVREYVFRERRRMSASSDVKVQMDLKPLGLGALMHDVGMIPLASLYHHAGPLSQQQAEAMRRHPVVGAEQLPEGFPPAARCVVRSHHENMDGGGYPDGLCGSSLHVFTRIVRVADAFDAGTSQTMYRDAKTPARVLWEITAGPCKRHYDPVVAKVFVGLIQPFPIGARLRLSDGTYGVVVRHNPRQPFAPTVVVAFDGKGRRITKESIGRPVNLASQRQLRITSMGRERLTYIYSGTGVVPASPGVDQAGRLFSLVYP